MPLAWAPAWVLRLHVSLAGLAALYTLLASGIGGLVLDSPLCAMCRATWSTTRARNGPGHAPAARLRADCADLARHPATLDAGLEKR
jgi:hypothetical protein